MSDRPPGPPDPTQWLPPTAVAPGGLPPGAPPPGPPGPPPGAPPPGAPPPGEDPNRTLAWVVVGLVVVLLILLAVLLATRHKGNGSGAAGPTTVISATTTTSSTSSTTTTTASTTTTLPPTTTTAPSTTTTSTTSTTSTTETTGRNRAPTPGEQAALTAAGQQDYPDYQITLIRIADSDNTWAAVQYQPNDAQAAQAFSEVRHLVGGVWQSVARGTAQVDCSTSVPKRVQADFADVLGSC